LLATSICTLLPDPKPAAGGPVIPFTARRFAFPDPEEAAGAKAARRR